MPAQKGRDFLLKIGSVTLAALTTTSFTVNSETIEVTTKDSTGRWVEKLAGANTPSVSISASGLMNGGTQFKTLFDAATTGTLDSYTLVFDNADTLVGTFAVTSLEASGEFNGAQTYSVSLESSGAIAFTQTA